MRCGLIQRGHYLEILTRTLPGANVKMAMPHSGDNFVSLVQAGCALPAGVAKACAHTCAAGTAACATAAAQAPIAASAALLLVSAAQGLPAAGASPRVGPGLRSGSAHVAAAGAAAAALRPGVIVGADAATLLRAALALALEAPDQAAASAAAAAAAGLLNKWDAGDVDAAVGQALDGMLLPRVRPPFPSAGLPRALACLGAVAAALAMRAHPRTQASLNRSASLRGQQAASLPDAHSIKARLITPHVKQATHAQ